MIKKVKKGFTLIELVVVIAVIAILSAVSVVAYVGITNNAKKSAASQKATQALTAIRAAVLASDKGYTEEKSGVGEGALGYTEEGTSNYIAVPYTVTLDGKELKFSKLVSGEPAAIADGDDIKILKDMLGEIGESDLAKLTFRFETNSSNESKLGVLIEGKEANNPDNYQYAAF